MTARRSARSRLSARSVSSFQSGSERPRQSAPHVLGKVLQPDKRRGGKQA